MPKFVTKTIVLYVLIISTILGFIRVASANQKPNILWLTSEDNGPDLGCYGDEYATTPNLDELAGRGLRYNIAWSTVPVCAPARTCLITGMYPCTIGAQHMRSMVVLDEQIKPFTIYLRENGYYCTNNRKEDYNFKKPKGTWDESSNKGHWRNRNGNQPFFSVFNHTISHESKIRNRPHELVHDPAKARIPKYHPDLPEVRRDWAQYYDRLTEMDAQVGKKLQQLEKDGLVDDTIVFYFGDHGCGMPRHKRSVTNSGLHVPLLIYIPEKFKHLRPKDYLPGAATNRMVAFIDFAPTVLSLAGIKPPQYMQGRAFLGEFAGKPKEFLVGMRGRMDERIDFSRSIRDGRYIYIRNYLPHLPEGQYLHYQMQTPTTRVWHQAFLDGKLNDAQKQFWMPKPHQALFDLKNDPDQVNNLAESSEHKKTLDQMSLRLLKWQKANKDVGVIPEIALNRFAENRLIYELKNGSSVSIVEQPGDKNEPFDMFLAPGLSHREKQKAGFPVSIDMTGPPVFRYWQLIGYLVELSDEQNEFSDQDKKSIVAELKKTFTSEQFDEIAILQCEIVALIGADSEKRAAVQRLVEFSNLEKHDVYSAIAALNAIDRLGVIAKPLQKQIETLPKQNAKVHSRMNQLVPRLVEKILDNLKAFEQE